MSWDLVLHVGGGQPGYEGGRDVQVLDGHRLPVHQPEPGDVDDVGGG